MTWGQAGEKKARVRRAVAATSTSVQTVWMARHPCKLLSLLIGPAESGVVTTALHAEHILERVAIEHW